MKYTKKFITTITLFLILFSASYSQDSNIVITETGETMLCEKIVIVDALWFYDGTSKAEISVLEKQNSKPITGGYKKGDEITISSEPGCTYYIFSITKIGGLKSKGLVTLSKSPPLSNTEKNKDVIIQEEFSSYKFEKFDCFVSSIKNTDGNKTANIIITQNTVLIENLVLSKGDLVWLGEKLYKVESIQTRSQFIKTDPEKIYEPLPGKIEFKAVKEYIYEK